MAACCCWHSNLLAKLMGTCVLVVFLLQALHISLLMSLTDAALKGIGIVQLPDYYVRSHIEEGRLVSILEKFRTEDEGIWAIYPQNRHLSPKVRLLIDSLYDGLSKCPEA